MGAYLSEPNLEKQSSDDTNDFMEVGASSMQGWRISQEDAHNCLLNFDNNISLFAVYDGHGGAEVAVYCSQKFPEFLKTIEAYKEKDFEKALKDAFLQFDATLLEDDVIETLKTLAGDRNPNDGSEEEDDEEEENLDELCQEGILPLDQVLEKYKGSAEKFPLFNRIKRDDAGASCSKPRSPFLRGRKNIADVAETAASSNAPTSSLSTFKNEKKSIIKNIISDTDDALVSSSSSNQDKSQPSSSCSNDFDLLDKKDDKSLEKLNGPILVCSSPDSSSSNKQELMKQEASKCQNGEISSIEEIADSNIKSKSESVTSSSLSASSSTMPIKSENGNVSSCSEAISIKTHLNAGQMGSISSTSNSIDMPDLGKSEILAQEDDDTSSDDDADFQADENSSTEDGEEDCEPLEVDTEEEEEDEEEDTDDEMQEIEDCERKFYTNMIEEPGKDSGCTAVVTLFDGRDLYVANAGDSRCILCRNGETIEMSLDHKPEDQEEMQRIQNAGGKVTLDGRVNGGLNLSRAIGDHAYKMNSELPPEKQMISALPDIKKIVITPNDEFMILACDGIWNSMSSQEVVAFIKARINDKEKKLSKICEELFENCLAVNTLGDGTGCDNMTAVIVRFKPKLNNLPSRIPDIDILTEIVKNKRSASPNLDNNSTSNKQNNRKKIKVDEASSSSNNTNQTNETKEMPSTTADTINNDLEAAASVT